MRTKYQRTPSLIFWSGPQRCSPEWRELVKAWFIFAKRCGWTVGKGEMSFWFDNWNEEFSFESLAVDGFAMEKLCDFWDGMHWDFDELIPTIGQELF